MSERAAVDEVKQLIAARQFQDAVRKCRRELLSRPGEVDVRRLLGEALMALARYDDVISEMGTLLRNAPQDGAALRMLGEARLRKGDEDGARASLSDAIAAGDSEAQALLAELDPPPSFSDETTQAESGPAHPSLPSLNRPAFEDPTQTATYDLGGTPVVSAPATAGMPTGPSVELDAAFSQEVEELEGEATMMTSADFVAKARGPSSPPVPRREPLATSPAAPAFQAPPMAEPPRTEPPAAPPAYAPPPASPAYAPPAATAPPARP
ncbi:MAG: hypothetical protein AAF411_22225, partial [Myxococcota bacterium]